MKRFIIALVILLTIATTAAAETYPQTFIVIETDQATDLLTLETFTGFTYQAYGIEDYMTGDIVAAIMEDNNTDDITDDAIMQLRYTGYVDGWQD